MAEETQGNSKHTCPCGRPSLAHLKFGYPLVALRASLALGASHPVPFTANLRHLGVVVLREELRSLRRFSLRQRVANEGWCGISLGGVVWVPATCEFLLDR